MHTMSPSDSVRPEGGVDDTDCLSQASQASGFAVDEFGNQIRPGAGDAPGAVDDPVATQAAAAGPPTKRLLLIK